MLAVTFSLLIFMLAEGRQTTPEMRLKEDLYNEHYDPLDAPKGLYNNETVLVSIEVSLRSILEVDPKKGVFGAVIMYTLEWEDSRLKWKTENYGGLSHHTIHPSKIWTPNITLLNSIDNEFNKHTGFTNVQVSYSGACTRMLPSLAHAYCAMDVQGFPFDTHTCSLIFGSWTQIIDLLPGEVLDTLDLKASGEWEYVSFENGHQSIDVAEFKISIRRRSAYYSVALVMPSIMSAFLLLANFWLPPTAKEKIFLGGFMLLVFLLFFIHTIMIVPFNGGHIPKIVSFYGATLVLGGSSLVMSIATWCLSHSSTTSVRPAPALLKKFLSSVVAKFCCLQKDTSFLVFYDGKSSTAKLDQDWLMAATLLDRCLFIVYCIAFIIIIPVIFH